MIFSFAIQPFNIFTVIGIFKNNNPSGNALLFIYALVLKIPLFVNAKPPQLQEHDGILYKFILYLIGSLSSTTFFYSLVAFILFYTQAISFNKIVNNQKLHKQSNYLTGMSYLLITSLFSSWFVLSAPLLVSSLAIYMWGKLSTLYNNANPKTTIFNIGLITGICSFIYFPSIAFIILVMVGVAVAKTFKLQEWIMGLVGIVTPIYFYIAWLFLSSNPQAFKFAGFTVSIPYFYNNKLAYFALALIALSTIIGLIYTNKALQRQVVQTRKSWQLLFLYLIVAAIIPFINTSNNFTYWILLAVPLAPIVASAFFYPKKKYISLVLHWSMFALYIYIHFFTTYK